MAKAKAEPYAGGSPPGGSSRQQASEGLAGVRYKRVLLKISGEALAGNGGFGIDADALGGFARELKGVHELGCDLALVVGGGNFFRGLAVAEYGIDRATGDYMGMLATLINSLALQDALERIGVKTRVLSAIEVHQVAEPYIRRRATRHLEKGRVIIFAAGTGNPYFSTDTAASLRAMEIDAEVILKGTRVEGVYDSDPLKNKDAKLYRELSYMDVINKELKVMDSTAVSLCMDNDLPIVVFNMLKPGNIKKAVCGKPIGTMVRSRGD